MRRSGWHHVHIRQDRLAPDDEVEHAMVRRDAWVNPVRLPEPLGKVPPAWSSRCKMRSSRRSPTRPDRSESPEVPGRFGSAVDKLGESAFSVLPMLGLVLLAMSCRRGVSRMLAALVTWWPAALHLPGYVLASAFAASFRLGVGLMWHAGGFAAMVVSGLGVNRTG